MRVVARSSHHWSRSSWLTHEELGPRPGPNTQVDRFCRRQLGSVYGCSPVYGFAPPRMKWRTRSRIFMNSTESCHLVGRHTCLQPSALASLSCVLSALLLMKTMSAQDPDHMVSWDLPDRRGALMESPSPCRCASPVRHGHRFRNRPDTRARSGFEFLRVDRMSRVLEVAWSMLSISQVAK